MCYEMGRALMKIIMEIFGNNNGYFNDIFKKRNKILVVTRREKKFEKINIGKWINFFYYQKIIILLI